MVTKVQIENFKSIEKLSLSLGRVNVLIGENGCGKTNILEGIAMAAAAEDTKNLNEHLANRGVRVTPSPFMRASFEEEKQGGDIKIKLNALGELNYNFEFYHNNSTYSDWNLRNLDFITSKPLERVSSEEKIRKKVADEYIEVLKKQNQLITQRPIDSEAYTNLVDESNALSENLLKKLSYAADVIDNYERIMSFINDFVIYAPENHFLRKTDELGTVEPLGYRGEGLIKLVSVLHKEKPEAIEEIKKHLRLISWFEDFEIVNDAFTGSYVKIRDAYLGKDIYYPNLKSTNEGFLFLLFYLTLFIAEYTPKFFAIDNIDNALNPKLCRELVKVLTQLAKKYDKQVIFTTHNPAVLDGLNLDDDEQRLFVVYRNAEGRTKTRRVKKRETPEGYEPMRMSEQYMNGFIGGLPKNF
ncbi:MAG: AAA family ATPase [Chitinophagales bacterium]